MLDPLYTNTYTKDVTANIVANTGLDWSEIEDLLGSQDSNCIELVMDGENVVIHQLVALLPDQSNKDCFETTISYKFCGQTMTYKIKLNITEDAYCDLPIITTINYSDMSFTINGSINSAVWLEYSTNSGSTYTRLPTAFPAGSSITTSALPTNVDLKIRLVAVCDETKISNVFDYDYVPPVELTAISLGYTTTVGSEACEDFFLSPVTRYVPATTPYFLVTTVLYQNAAGTIPAQAGFYSDGAKWRYWNEVSFISQGFC